MTMDDLIAEAGVIVGALKAINENIYCVKFDDTTEATKIQAQIQCLLMFAEKHDKNTGEVSKGQMK